VQDCSFNDQCHVFGIFVDIYEALPLLMLILMALLALDLQACTAAHQQQAAFPLGRTAAFLSSSSATAPTSYKHQFWCVLGGRGRSQNS
jgi:hypothetical protein